MEFRSISQHEFNEHVQGDSKPVCVAFGAEWSGAFYLVEPFLREFLKKSNGSIDLLPLDYDSNAWYAEKYGIHYHVPSIMIFISGVKTKEAVGITACLDLLTDMQLERASDITDIHPENTLSELLQKVA